MWLKALDTEVVCDPTVWQGLHWRRQTKTDSNETGEKKNQKSLPRKSKLNKEKEREMVASLPPLLLRGSRAHVTEVLDPNTS